MGLRIATNIQSLAGQRYLSLNSQNLNNTLERLASGSRINRAGDDAAGLAISEKLRSSVRSMKQATRNAQDGIGLVQVAEGGMNEIGNILIRLRELSVQGASDTIGNTERGFIDKEVQGLRQEVSRIANNTEFNGVKLLNGSGDALEVQVGINNNATLDRFVFDTRNSNVTAEALGLSNVNTMTKESSQQNLATLDEAITNLNSNRATLGALQNRLMSTINNLQIYSENMEAARSRVKDADMAQETSELAKANIINQANISVLAQANQTPAMVLKLLS